MSKLGDNPHKSSDFHLCRPEALLCWLQNSTEKHDGLDGIVLDVLDVVCRISNDMVDHCSDTTLRGVHINVQLSCWIEMNEESGLLEGLLDPLVCFEVFLGFGDGCCFTEVISKVASIARRFLQGQSLLSLQGLRNDCVIGYVFPEPSSESEISFQGLERVRKFQGFDCINFVLTCGYTESIYTLSKNGNGGKAEERLRRR